MQFDKSKPYNDLPKIPPVINLEDQEMLLATLEAGEAISRLSTMLTVKVRNLANTLDLLSPLFVPEAVSSSGIENIITTNDSVYVARVLEDRELSPAEKEALNYTDALYKGFQVIMRKQFLSTTDYITLQRMLEPKKSGIRKLPGTQLQNPVTKEVYYTPPEGESLIRDLLANFEQYFNDRPPTHEVYSRMAILHYQFEAIHPFPDGNGRTGRMLMPLYLTAHMKLPAPVLFISKYILDHRDEYYEKLRNVTYKGEWKEWILYIIHATIEQAKYTTAVLERIELATEEVRGKLQKELKHIYSSELVDFLFSNVYFTQKLFEAEMGISQMTARKYLQALESKKIILKRKQKKRNRYLYITPRYINILKPI